MIPQAFPTPLQNYTFIIHIYLPSGFPYFLQANMYTYIYLYLHININICMYYCKFRLEEIYVCIIANSDLKKVEKTTKPLRHDLNQILYDYTVEVKKKIQEIRSERQSA